MSARVAPSARGALRRFFAAPAARREAGAFALATGLLVAGLALQATGLARAADAAWALVAAGALAAATVHIVRDLLRRHAGVDLIALLALAGALALGEYLAGAVIGVMLATGRALESFAAARAERELSALLERAPRVAHRLVDGTLTTIPVDEVQPHDRLLVKEADVVPVDGTVVSAAAQLDESALTGESRVAERVRGDVVRSGVVNAGPPFELIAIAGAAGSAYAGIVRLVREAQHSKAPFVRLADRYAAIFVPVTLVVAGVAWAIAGSPVRALAVLVVATPCPLLLAAPIAIVSGISRAARRGIIVKDGGALETLARAQALYFDKTGTLTAGSPVLTDVFVVPPWTDPGELLGLAAAVDQLSSHVLAAAIVRGARERAVVIALPDKTREAPGGGIEGVVAGRRVLVGSLVWVTKHAASPPAFDAVRRRLRRLPGTIVVVAVDGSVAGAIVLDDPLRPDAARTVRSLKRLGFDELVMLTGDHPLIAESVGLALGIDRVLADRSPEEKVEAVRESSARRLTVMVGDGINDAPALAVADVGVAMGARGATSSSEAADVVLVADRLDRLVDAVEIARWSRTVAVQSVWVGMALSAVAMVVAAAGYLPPVAGALVQEGIDALAILSALRALRGGVRRAPLAPIDGVLARQLREEHEALLPRIDRVRAVADGLGDAGQAASAAALRALSAELHEYVLPHERADEHELHPALAEHLPGDDPLAGMSRSHAEIFHLVRLLDDLIEDAGTEGLPLDLMPDARRVLYGLHAVLRLHFAHEEELYQSLAGDDEAEPAVVAAR